MKYLRPICNHAATTRVVITLIIILMVISSPVFVLLNPAVAVVGIDTSNHHSSLPISEISLSTATPSSVANMTPSTTDGGDFTTQAALTLTRATQTNNIVNTRSYYDIAFRTSTPGVVKTVEMAFPPGTYVGVSLLVEATGIGSGKIQQSTPGTLVYTVTNPVNIPANTNIRIQISNINNPTTPNSALTVTITTKNAGGGIIDGPTPTFPYNIKKVGTNDISDNAVTGQQVHNLDELYFKTCTIDWGTVLAGQQKSASCGVVDPLMNDNIYRVVATQTSGNEGLTLLKVESLGGFDSNELNFYVANNTPNELNIGAVKYSMILFLCNFETQPC